MAKQDIFLKLPGIDGESKDPSHLNELQLSSFGLRGFLQMVAVESVVGSTAGATKVVLNDLECVKSADKAGPNLFKAMWEKQKIPKATLIVRKAGKAPMEYMKYELEEVLVSSVSVACSGAEDGPIPQERFTLSFAKLTIEYKEQNPDGTLAGNVKANYNLKAGQ